MMTLWVVRGGVGYRQYHTWNIGTLHSVAFKVDMWGGGIVYVYVWNRPGSYTALRILGNHKGNQSSKAYDRILQNLWVALRPLAHGTCDGGRARVGGGRCSRCTCFIRATGGPLPLGDVITSKPSLAT